MRRRAIHQIDNGNLKKKIYLIAFLIIAVGGAVVCAAVAAERSGMFWIGLGGEVPLVTPEDNKGFFTVDVSDFVNSAGTDSEIAEANREIVPLAIGPLPNIPTLTDEELRLYGFLTNNNGQLSSEDKTSLDKDIHWTEIVLESGDTLKSIAEKFDVSEEDLRQANGLRVGDKLDPTEVLYVPNSHEDVVATLLFVRALQQQELALTKKGKLIEVKDYVVANGDTLWGISAKFDVDVDTILGSNQNLTRGSINRLRPGMKLRIPNQDGVFVKVSKNDTLAKITQKYGSTSEAVLIANAMKSDNLIAGDEIFLPGGKLVANTEVRVAARTPSRTFSQTVALTGGGSGSFSWPAMGRLTSNYGWRKSPFGKRRVFHSGLDIAAPRGTPIKAPADGTVVHSGWMGGYGRTIVLSHSNGLTTLYAHCNTLLVGVGAHVSRGQTIALVGSTGRSTGNHLHFEVRTGGKTLNPMQYLK